MIIIGVIYGAVTGTIAKFTKTIQPFILLCILDGIKIFLLKTKGNNGMTSDILLTAIILFSIGVVFLIIVLTLKKTEKNFFSKCIAAKGIVISYQATAGSNNGSAPVVKFFDNGVEAKGKASVSNIFSKRVHVGEEVDILYVNKLVFGLPAYGIKILSNPDKSPNAGTVIANVFLAISLVTITASIVLCIMSTPL